MNLPMEKGSVRMAHKVKTHAKKVRRTVPADRTYIEAAVDIYRDKLGDDFETDGDVQVSRTDDGTGAWVRGWVWVYTEDAVKVRA